MHAPPLLVLIPSHGRPALLGRALRSVAACERPPGYAGCVVVENGPAAGAEAVVAEVAAEHPGAGLRYMHVGRANKSAALNAALKGVEAGTLCVFFDDDVRVAPGTLAAYADATRRYPQPAFFGGPFEVDYEERPAEWVHAVLPLSAQGAGPEALRKSGMFLGFNWAAYARDLIEAGGFDPDFGPGSPTGASGQETDMQQRLQRAGHKDIIVLGAMVWHYVPVERSGFRWAIARKYRVGLSLGLSTQRDDEGRRRARRALSHLGRMAYWTLRVNPRRMALHLAQLSKSIGVLRGLAAQKRLSPPASR